MTQLGPSTEKVIGEVVAACESYGETSIIALAGVPATGKSFIAAIAAQRFAGEPTRVREVQFHQSFTYEEFMEGLRIAADGSVEPVPGVFLEWNDLANDDGSLRYVLLIEELTRANVSAVLGELLTFVEHRNRPFLSMFSRRLVRVAPNITIIATFNPVDRSALDIDAALLRRLRVIDMPPDNAQLEEMLAAQSLPQGVTDRIRQLFAACETAFPDDFETLMPFGHGVFSEIKTEADLYPLWQQRLKRMLYRPLRDPHPFAEVIKAAYPWTDKAFSVASPEAPPSTPAAVEQG